MATGTGFSIRYGLFTDILIFIGYGLDTFIGYGLVISIGYSFDTAVPDIVSQG